MDKKEKPSVLKEIAKGLNEGLNKSPFPNPIGTVAGGIGGISGGIKNYRKKKITEKNKEIRKKQREGKAYLRKLKSTLEGNKIPNMQPKKPTFTKPVGVAGMINYIPPKPITPHVKVSKKLTKQ